MSAWLRDRRPGRAWIGTDGLRILVLVLYPLLGLVVAPIAWAGARQGLGGFQLFNDTAHEIGILWGIFSYFGILMWAVGTTCCTIAWAFLARTSPLHPLVPWFRATAVLSAVLTVDDTFAIHEFVLPNIAGVPEKAVLFVYSIAIVWYLVRFRRELIQRADSVVILISLFFFGSSLTLDIIGWTFPFSTSIEDLAKLLGLTAWVYFFYRAALDVITEQGSSAESAP